MLISKRLSLAAVMFFGASAAYAEVTTALQFVPVTPCRVMDTRNATGTFGGPIIAAAATREIPVPQSACGIPASARAYSMNITVVPPAALGYLSIWPTGQPLPLVSTLNALDGRIAANAAIVPAGSNGSVSVFVSNATHVIMDINGYFVPASTAASLAFYPTPPCRVADTRGNGLTGAFGPPALAARATRDFPVPSGSCSIPSNAQAYSLNITVVPTATLGYLSAWPAGLSQPLVSTLNALDGDIIANAAIVPAGANGGVSLYATDATNVIIDINGYFAPPGGTGAVSLYTVPPCRVADTRGNGSSGAFGTPSMVGGATRGFPVPSSPCSIPTTATAFSMNATIVPQNAFGYLTIFPAGQAQPTVSTLNSLRAKITANAVLVPAGTSGAVNAFVTNTADLILDINGYFGQSGAALSPTIISSASAGATIGTAYSYAVLATNPNPPAVLTFSLTSAPAGMTIDAATGLIQWTPVAAQLGPQQAQVRVTDSQGRSATQSFTVNAVEPLQSGPATFSAGTMTTLANQTIGAVGGTIAINGTGTALDGARIVFPAGAVAVDTPVRISINRGALVPVSGTYSGVALDITVTGVTTFSQPISITVPYTGGAASVPVPYYADASGALSLVQLTNLNRAAGTFTFQTFHASLYTWIFGLLNPGPAVASTAFNPANDGFQVVNRQSVYNNGECLGMTSFSLWWLRNHKTSLGTFFPRYMSVVGTDSVGASLRGQNVIATRAFISIAQQWSSYVPAVRRELNLQQSERYGSIYNAVANTRAPVLIYLSRGTAGPERHSVLAYQVDNNSGAILVYDPNKPGTAQNIQYSPSAQTFSPYCNTAAFCYDDIIYNGDGNLNLTEPYSNIVADAQSNFSNSTGATVTISSHVDGQTVSSRLATLQGTVRSGQVLVTRMTAVVGPGPTEYTVSVPASGVFSIPIALVDGVNPIKFRTEGAGASGAFVTTTNNFNIREFTLKAVVPASVILMTLTWDKSNTDVDTYVIDPTGDYSSWYKRITADGGTLDRDVTTGYGPEHWTLLNSNVVRYNQPYKFRLHYYTDNGNGPINYTVTIELYNGTSRQATYAYSGSLSVSNPNNDRPPTATGADWRDIATVVLTPAGTSSGAEAPTVSAGIDGELRITVPVPEASAKPKQP